MVCLPCRLCAANIPSLRAQGKSDKEQISNAARHLLLAVIGYNIVHMNKKLASLWGIIGVAILLGASYYIYQQFHTTSVASYAIQPIPVETVTVQEKAIPHTIQALGSLQAFQQIDVSPQVDGHIKQILFQDGQYVTKGQILVQMSDAEVDAQLASSVSALALAKLQYGRLQQLAKHSAVSKDTLDQSRNTYLQAKAQVQQNQAQVTYTVLQAPFDGYLGAHVVDQGQFIQAGTTIVTLVGIHQLKVNYQVPSQFMPQLHPGQLVNVTSDAYPKTKFQGSVNFVSPYVDSGTRTVHEQALLPNPDRKLAPGMFVQIEQVLSRNQKSMVVPIAALVPSITGTFVYKIVNGHAVTTPVTVGVYWNKYVEILSGVNIGEVIVMTGQQRLRDGMQVKVVPNTWTGLNK